MPMLELKGIEAGYGAGKVLNGVDLAVGAHEVVTLIGRNGMGKTTTVRAIMGMLRIDRGSVTFDGARIERLPSYRVAQSGVGLVHEGRHIFPNLTVRENLVATAGNRRGAAEPWRFDDVLTLFPKLRERLDQGGARLSGGEQQMLAIGRALLTNPKLLIMDEATEGLAPLVREDIWRCIEEIKRRGQSILLIDKNLNALSRIANRHYVMEKGRIVWSGDSDALRRDPEAKRYLDLSEARRATISAEK
jgi:branched-chain amino acid transport system ATP-binding protein